MTVTLLKPMMCIILSLFILNSTNGFIGTSENKMVTDKDMDLQCPEITVTRNKVSEIPWPEYRADYRHSGSSPYSTENNNGGIKWTCDWDGDPFYYQPILGSNDTVFTFSRNDRGINLAKINSTGNIMKNITLVNNSSLSVSYMPTILDNNTILFLSETNYTSLNSIAYLNAYDYNLNLKWKLNLELPDIHGSPPSIAPDGTIYVIVNETLIAVDQNKTIKWKKTFFDENPLGSYSVSSPVISDDNIIYVDTYGPPSPIKNRLYAINPNGSEKWNYSIEKYHNPSYLVVGTDNSIYCSFYNYHERIMYSISPDGKLKWHINIAWAAFSFPTVGNDGTIYICSIDGGLYALNPDGTEKWEFKFGENDDIALGAGSIDPNGIFYVVVKYSDNDESTIFEDSYHLYSINPDGTLRWKIQPDAEGLSIIQSSPIIGSDGTVYLMSEKKSLDESPYGSYFCRLYAINGNRTPEDTEPTEDGGVEWLDLEDEIICWVAPIVIAIAVVLAAAYYMKRRRRRV